jgi:transposase
MASSLPCVQPNAAGIDVGSKSHFVAVPADRDPEPVREFGFFTEDLHRLAQWLKQCKIETVAFEATGSYWIPLYDVLVEADIEVYLVNPRHMKNVSGRKTDVQDCQWIQQLHSCGLLRASFVPDQLTAKLRHFVRHRDTLIRHAATQMQLMQKALVEMNLQLHNVVRDITGDTGMKIIRAICNGERDPKKLSEYRDCRCKNSKETIEKSLRGHYKNEVLFCLKQALQTYDHYQQLISDCNKEIETHMKDFEDQSGGAPLPEGRKRETKKNGLGFDVQGDAWKALGVDLMKIPSMNTQTVLTIIAEIGTSVDKWPSAKHFASWLGLSSNNRVSGGKRLSGRTRPSSNRLRRALRIAAMTLERTSAALGVFYRRMKARLGAPKAIIAAARKLAVLIYTLIKNRLSYEAKPLDFEKEYRKRDLKRLKWLAETLGYDLSPKPPENGDVAIALT